MPTDLVETNSRFSKPPDHTLSRERCPEVPAGSMNKGSMASAYAGSKLTKLVIGIPGLALGLFGITAFILVLLDT